MTYDFFLAHAAVDAARVRELHDVLVARGFAVFLDAVSLVPGDRWDRAIPAALERSRVCVAVMSEAGSKAGFYDKDEVAQAIELYRAEKLRIVPVSLDGVRPTYGLRTLVSLPFDGDWSAVVSRLAALPGLTAAIPSRAAIPVSTRRLPHVGAELFGREAELARLHNAWADPGTHVISVIASGGIGKTSLVKHWVNALAREGYPGAARVYAWSFYSQGTGEGRQASGDLFIDQALRWFGDPTPEAGSAWDKGERLAALVRRERTLLILDGIEPLQHPPGQLGGQLKDPAVQVLLEELSASNQGLCVVSSRLELTDLADSGAPVVHLGPLSADAGTRLLRARNVSGEDEELEEVVKRMEGHALAVFLLGNYVHERFGGDVRRWREVPALRDAEKGGDHARKVMAAYEAWLPKPECSVLRMLGLFDRPAPPELVAELRPLLIKLADRDWELALAHLGEVGLVSRFDGTLDAHPLVREHFGERLRETDEAAWKAGHLRLYEVLCKAAKDLPDTLEEMEPLLQAIPHGCAAGRVQEVFDEVYWRRVRRQSEAYIVHELGAFAADLSALSHFFAERWSLPHLSLTPPAQSVLLSWAGYALRGLGRLAEAAGPMEAALVRYRGDEHEEAIAAGNLSELLLTLGRIPEAIARARESVPHADRSGDSFQRSGKRTTLADAYHQSGALAEARDLFAESERMQVERQPAYPLLYSLAGFRYGDLLLTTGDPAEARRRAEATLPWMERQRWLLDIALDHLLLGRAAHALGDRPTATKHLDLAVTGLRRAGRQDFVPPALLARAALHRDLGNLPAAEHDLAEATRIARRGSMRLFLADCALERARLTLAQGNLEAARRARDEAREMINTMGYHRRDPDLAALDAAL